MASARLKYYSVPHRQTAWLFIFWCLTANAQTPAQSEKVPEAYLQVRHAMGEGKLDSAHVRMNRLFRHKEIYPPLYETAAYVYVYEKRYEAGHAFFDSLLAAGHHPGNVAGAHAILWQTQQEPDSSLKYARLAVVENSQCIYPYEVFVDKSLELNKSHAARDLLKRQYRQYPENWRFAFAEALWHNRQTDFEAARAILHGLLSEGNKHWRIYYTLGVNTGNLFDWQKARAIYQEGFSFCDTTNDEEGLVRMLHGRAQAERVMGELYAAASTLQQGLELARRIGNRLLEGRLLLLLGQTRLQQHQWSEAERTFTTVVQRAHEYSDGEPLLHAYNFLSELALQRGRRSEALAYAHKAFDAADSLGMRSSAASFLFDLTLIELETGRVVQALALAQKVLAYVQNEKLSSYVSFAYQNLASILKALGRYPEALDYCEKARDLAQKSSNFEQVLKLELLRGEILLHHGQIRTAHAVLSRVGISAKTAKLMTPFMHAQILLARMEMGMQQYAQAKLRLAHALAALPETPAYETNLTILALFADVAWQTGRRAEALKIYEDAVKTIAAQTHRFGPQNLSSLSGVERDIFFRLSCAYVEIGELERALAETERARDLIVKRKHWQAQQLRTVQTGNLKIRRLAELDSLLQLVRLQKAVTDSAHLQLELAAKIIAWERQHTALQDSILGVNVASWLESVPFPMQDFRRSLQKRNELALSFFVGDSSTLVFFLAADTVTAATIAIGQHDLEQQLLRIHQVLNTTNAGALTQETAKLDTAAAAGIYRLLLHEFLAERPETAVAIVPDGILHALPFEILSLPTENQGRPMFLVERFAVRYGNSLADLQQNGQDNLRVKSFLLAAAPELHPAHDAIGSVTQRSARWSTGTVGRLESEIVRSLVRCKIVLTGAALTRDALLPAMRHSDWVHIASHSFWQPSEPLFGEIVLSVPPDMSEPERLFAFEIFQMALPVQMAVLSGCETVRGTFVGSEGFEGLVQAFRAAGTPSVIASLWKVDDNATTQFFKFYYEALRSGQSTVRALQTAKIQMLNRSNFNFTDWAAFTYYGRDWRVELPRPWSLRDWALLVVIIAFLLLTGWWLVWRRRKVN